MTDGFDALFAGIEQAKVSTTEWAPVIESQLECETCYALVTDGTYSKKRQELRFVCANGHKNSVEMDLTLD